MDAFPSLRHTEIAQTRDLLARWADRWAGGDLSIWMVREAPGGPVLGNAGCVRRGGVWNLGYRLDAGVHGRGYATEAARRSVAAAREVDPDVPVTAYLVAHNHASARVAEAVGLTLRHQAPDAGKPGPVGPAAHPRRPRPHRRTAGGDAPLTPGRVEMY